MEGAAETMIRISDAGHQRQLIYDRYVKYLFVASAFLVSLLIFSIIFFVGKQGLMTFADVSPLEFFFSAKWAPESQQYGALSFIVGSLQVTFLAVLIGCLRADRRVAGTDEGQDPSPQQSEPATQAAPSASAGC